MEPRIGSSSKRFQFQTVLVPSGSLRAHAKEAKSRAPNSVLDEVDAPLDDANVTRFCDLLDEMCRQTDTRFLIITHHAVTMARMDRLFGVTMAEQGVSQLVSVDLKKAETLVA